MSTIIAPTDYKASAIQGKQRIHGGKFGNALDQIQWISFDEELITLDNTTGEIYRNPAGSCQTSLTDPAKPLTLRNPLDDSIIGTSTYQDVMILLYSLGRQTQIERDEALANPVVEVDTV